MADIGREGIAVGEGVGVGEGFGVGGTPYPVKWFLLSVNFIAVLVGLSVLIPYVGAFTVTIPIIIIGLLHFGLGRQFYLLLGLYIVLQFIDGNLLVPIIFSEACIKSKCLTGTSNSISKSFKF